MCFSNNIYIHFASHVQKFVRNAFFLSKEELSAMTKPLRMRRKTELAKVAYDLCSPTGAEWKSAAAYHGFLRDTRAQWKLDEFPWDDKPLAWHLKANDSKAVDKCHAHLLLPALWHMRIQRQVHGQKGFALLPLRTTLVPRHTHFGPDTLRSLLGVGGSEHKRAKTRERHKRRKLSTCAGSSTQHAQDEQGTNEEDDDEPKKRKRRPKAETDAEKRKDLGHLFDLKKAGIHDVKGKVFDCTFTSYGVAAHLRVSSPASKPLSEAALPTRGIFDIDDLAARLRKNDRTPEHKPPVDAATSPKGKLEKLCICCDNVFRSPIPGFVCVGCDPGKNEPACMVEPISGANLRMTSTGRRQLCNSPGKFVRTARHVLQSIRKGKGVDHAEREASAAAYRAQYVENPVQINRLECELGMNGCSNAPCLLHFGMYIDALKAREAVLVPRYSQLHHRKLCRKRHIETQRFESRFIRDGSRRRNRVDNSRK